MCWPSPVCSIFDYDNPAQDLLKKIDKQIIDACTQTLTSLGTFWVKVKTPDLTGGAKSDVSGHAAHAQNIETILGYVTWIGLGLAVASLIALGAMIAARIRSGEGVAAVGKIGVVLGGVIGLSGASSIVSHALPHGPHGVGGATGFLQSSLWWYMAAAATASVIIGAIKMIWEQRAEPGRETLKSLLTLIIVAAAGVTIINMLITAADSFSVWVIDNAMACSPGDPTCFVSSVKRILYLSEDSGATNGVLLGILIALLALLTDLIQIILIVARSAMLVLLTGVLPLAASATNTEMGKMWFKRCTSWLTAFLLYKPVASLIYAAAFKLVTNDLKTQDQLLNTLTGAMLMLLAVLALPALLRFVAPMASAASGGHASGAAAMLAASRLPSGARAGGSSQTTNSTTTTTTRAPSGSSDGGSGNRTGNGSAGSGTQSAASNQSSAGQSSTGQSSTGQGSAGGTTVSQAGSGAAQSATDSSATSPSVANRSATNKLATNQSATNQSGGNAGASGSTGRSPGAGSPGASSTGTSTGASPETSTGSGAGGQSGFTTTTTSQASRGRRYSEGSPTSGRLLQAAGVAAGAAHAITEETTGSGQ